MRRFYSDVAVQPASGGGWQVTLDGRPVKTPAGRPQIVPSETLAHALAGEWADQGEKIDKAKFRFRDHADYAIDIVASDRDAVIAKLLAFAETDTLCYRAGPGDPLCTRQEEVWDPLLAHVEERHGVRFARVSGIMHSAQPEGTMAALRDYLTQLDDFTLSALLAMASLPASLVVALLGIDDAINDPAALWRDANLEEEWQAERWGRDAEAEQHRAQRYEAFSSAQVFAAMIRYG